MRVQKRSKNDEEPLQEGDFIILRSEEDAKPNTRKFPIYERIDLMKYLIVAKNGDLVHLQDEIGILI